MKKISQWAKTHKRKARVIIVASFVLLTALGIAAGSLLNELGITISSLAMLVFICIYITSALAYPARSLKKGKLTAGVFYIRQKTCDFLLAASTFCMIVFFSNRPDQVFNYTTALNATVPMSAAFPKDSSFKNYKPIAAFAASLKDETGKSLKWKEKKKLLKEQIRAIKRDNDMSNGAKAGLIILSVLLAIGLLYGVAALACSLSCGGSEGAATLVMIGGVGLVVFLLVMAIRAITKKNNKPKTTGPEPAEPVKTNKKE